MWLLFFGCFRLRKFMSEQYQNIGREKILLGGWGDGGSQDEKLDNRGGCFLLLIPATVTSKSPCFVGMAFG